MRGGMISAEAAAKRVTFQDPLPGARKPEPEPAVEPDLGMPAEPKTPSDTESTATPMPNPVRARDYEALPRDDSIRVVDELGVGALHAAEDAAGERARLLQRAYATGRVVRKGFELVIRLFKPFSRSTQRFVEYIKTETITGNMNWNMYLHINIMGNDELKSALTDEGLL